MRHTRQQLARMKRGFEEEEEAADDRRDASGASKRLAHDPVLVDDALDWLQTPWARVSRDAIALQLVQWAHLRDSDVRPLVPLLAADLNSPALYLLWARSLKDLGVGRLARVGTLSNRPDETAWAVALFSWRLIAPHQLPTGLHYRPAHVRWTPHTHVLCDESTRARAFCALCMFRRHALPKDLRLMILERALARDWHEDPHAAAPALERERDVLVAWGARLLQTHTARVLAAFALPVPDRFVTIRRSVDAMRSLLGLSVCAHADETQALLGVLEELLSANSEPARGALVQQLVPALQLHMHAMMQHDGPERLLQAFELAGLQGNPQVVVHAHLPGGQMQVVACNVM